MMKKEKKKKRRKKERKTRYVEGGEGKAGRSVDRGERVEREGREGGEGKPTWEKQRRPYMVTHHVREDADCFWPGSLERNAVGPV